MLSYLLLFVSAVLGSATQFRGNRAGEMTEMKFRIRKRLDTPVNDSDDF
jgi:hypothetical protein